MTINLSPRVVTRWYHGVPSHAMATPTPFGVDRAKEIEAERRKHLCGELDPHMSDGEAAYVRAVWDTMPGSTTYNDAFCRILNGLQPIRQCVRVHFANGDHLETEINGTREEVSAYYMRNVFNIGQGGEDNVQRVTSVEFLN